MNINKNKKYKKEVTEDTSTIKEINGLVNRITDMNYYKIKPLIIEKIKSEHLIPYLIENICDNAILHHKYISLYVGVLKEINSKNKVKMIMKITSNFKFMVWINITMKEGNCYCFKTFLFYIF